MVKRRSESFFGLHSDFHAIPKDGLVIGATMREEDIREICETLRPDFVQVDCKGHPGWTSYPSSFSNAMPHFACDPLEMWRRVTREYGIALYVHFSGVYEMKYCRENPSERAICSDTDFSADQRLSVRLDGSYLDTFMIPQLCEVVERYGVDGVWIDGDCWAVKPDYRPENIAGFEAAMGIDLEGQVPKKKGDRYFDEFLEYTRNQYRDFLRHYVDVLHEKYPDLQICSNWAFSHSMPEKVCANVDFLSGDLSPTNAMNSARYAGRLLAQHGMSWDLMSWNFRYYVYGVPLTPAKRPIQIMQEAAAVIALGGAYQDNVTQFGDGSSDMRNLRRLRSLASFMRERQPFCFGGKPIHQTIMLASTVDRYANLCKPFGGAGSEPQMGLAALLCDAGQSFEIACEGVLEGRFSEYPLIIVPELHCGLDKTTVEALRRYALEGGSLLLVGSETCRLFAIEDFGFEAERYMEIPEVPNWANCDIGHDIEKFSDRMPQYFSLGGEELGVTYGAYRISVGEGGRSIGFLHTSMRGEKVPFAAVYSYGKGKIGVIGCNLGTQYKDGMQVLHRELIRAICDELYSPLARIESCCGILEIVCLEKDGRLLLQLVNGNGGHSNQICITEDYIPPVTSVRMSVEARRMPTRVVLQPEGRSLEYELKDGRVYFSIDSIDLHSIVEIDI